MDSLQLQMLKAVDTSIQIVSVLQKDRCVVFLIPLFKEKKTTIDWTFSQLLQNPDCVLENLKSLIPKYHMFKKKHKLNIEYDV